jgi:hypothetical protein
MGTPWEVPVPKKRNANDIVGDCEWSASDVKARRQDFDRDLDRGDGFPRLTGFSVVLRRKFCSSMLQFLLRIGSCGGIRNPITSRPTESFR